ncbi:MAG: hypothetical protein IJH68_01880 [Thermoguttaceae bacterium]|nr:hypothetical protein [Thermoguttaceae bacterium]
MRQNSTVPQHTLLPPAGIRFRAALSRLLVPLLWGVFLLLSAAEGGVLWGNVRLSTLYSSHMVLQRQRPIQIRGEATPGEKVTVTLSPEAAEKPKGDRSETDGDQNDSAQTDSAQADASPAENNLPLIAAAEADRNGVWSVTLPPLGAGGPYRLSVQGKKNRQEIQDIWLGDVWLFVGSRAMLREGTASQEDVPTADEQSNLRILSLSPVESPRRKSAIRGQWNLWDEEKQPGQLALAAAFGKELTSRLSVPIGIVITARDPAGIEQWLDPAFQTSGADAKNDFGALFNGTLAPLTHLAIRGAVFEPDDLDIPRAGQYGELLTAMIEQWRMDWRQGDFPFFYLETGALIGPDEDNTDSAAAEYRQAQRRAGALRLVSSVVTFDLGVPAVPEMLGRRLAEQVLREEYGQGQAGTQTKICAITFEGDRALVRFSGPLHPAPLDEESTDEEPIGDTQTADDTQIDDDTQTTDDAQIADDVPPIDGFVLAGPDRKFFKAQAVIEGDRVIVTSDFVASPAAVRYSWSDAPKGNLRGEDDLPVPGFRSDCWPLLTDPIASPQ